MAEHTDKFEQAILQALIFFSHFENKTPRAIEEIFLPQLIQNSTTFNRGLTLDLTKFGELNISQQLYFKSVFQNAENIKINVANVPETQVFYFLKFFSDLKSLQILLKDDTTFDFPLRKLKLEKIKIISTTALFSLDPIHQILSHNEPIVTSISLNKTHITLDTINLIRNYKLTKLSLTNTKFYCVVDLAALLYYVIHSETLKTLKLTFTEKTYCIELFESASDSLFEKIEGKRSQLTSLAFTINQRSDKINVPMENFPLLNKIVVYYSIEFDSKNIFCLIKQLKKLHDENTLNIAIIKFSEYYSKPTELEKMTREQRIKLLEKSENLKHEITEKSFKYFTIESINFI